MRTSTIASTTRIDTTPDFAAESSSESENRGEMFYASRVTVPKRGLQTWIKAIAKSVETAKCTTIGLTSGSRQLNDRRVIDMLCKALMQDFSNSASDPKMLVIRLDVRKSRIFETLAFDRLGKPQDKVPNPVRSPLGNWSTVDIPMPVGPTAAPALQYLPRWLPKWKEQFGLVLIDLGPMNMVPSRLIGRLCDNCFLLLGPDSCASQEWILQHMAWHDQSGSTIAGSILTTVAVA